MIRLIGTPLTATPTAMKLNSLQMVNRMHLTTRKQSRVVLACRDQWRSRASRSPPASAAKFTRSRIHKRPLMCKDHGCMQRTQQLRQCRKERRIRHWRRTTSYHCHWATAREHTSHWVMRSASTDIREILLSSRTKWSQENEKDNLLTMIWWRWWWWGEGARKSIPPSKHICRSHER